MGFITVSQRLNQRKIRRNIGWREYARVGTLPGHARIAAAGSSGSKLEHSDPLSLHRDVTSMRKACRPPVANPRYPMTDWMKFHSFQLNLAATDGRDAMPSIRNTANEIVPSKIEDSPHLQRQI